MPRMISFGAFYIPKDCRLGPPAPEKERCVIGAGQPRPYVGFVVIGYRKRCVTGYVGAWSAYPPPKKMGMMYNRGG